MTEKNEKKIVFPSDELAVEEELKASSGTHVENHKVAASVFGESFLDRERYQARVIPFPKSRAVHKRYDTVVGLVFRVGRSSMGINIAYVNNNPINPTFGAIMHISDASRDYIDNIDDAYASGDVIRAKIIDAKSFPVQLEAKGREFGVVHCLCDKCGAEVEKERKNLLKCKECGHEQKRNTAYNFGELNLIPKY